MDRLEEILVRVAGAPQPSVSDRNEILPPSGIRLEGRVDAIRRASDIKSTLGRLVNFLESRVQQ